MIISDRTHFIYKHILKSRGWQWEITGCRYYKKYTSGNNFQDRIHYLQIRSSTKIDFTRFGNQDVSILKIY